MSTAYTANVLVSTLLGLFWAWIASCFTANRSTVVATFVTVALLVFVAVAMVQGGADPEEMGE